MVNVIDEVTINEYDFFIVRDENPACTYELSLCIPDPSGMQVSYFDLLFHKDEPESDAIDSLIQAYVDRL